MKTINVLIGAAVALTAILVLYKILGRYLDNTDTDTSETDETRQQSQTGGSYSVPLLKKHKQFSWPMKAALSLIVLLGLAVTTYVFITLQKGAPLVIPHATKLAAGAAAGFALFVGIGLANYRTASRGRLEVIYENGQGNRENTETIFFNRDTTETDGDGNTVVKEQHATRILGLFARLKLVGHDPEVRTERVALGDPIRHRIPDHATRLAPGHWEIRTKGNVVNGDESEPHYDYKPSAQMPKSEARQLRMKNNRLERELETVESELAEAETQLERVQTRLESRDHMDREGTLDDLERILEKIPLGNQNYHVSKNNGSDRRPKSQREAAEEAPGQSD